MENQVIYLFFIPCSLQFFIAKGQELCYTESLYILEIKCQDRNEGDGICEYVRRAGHAGKSVSAGRQSKGNSRPNEKTGVPVLQR